MLQGFGLLPSMDAWLCVLIDDSGTLSVVTVTVTSCISNWATPCCCQSSQTQTLLFGTDITTHKFLMTPAQSCMGGCSTALFPLSGG
jgi:hypothetical protein